MKPIYIIAEPANAHDGNFDKAIELVQKIAETKADAIKFQIIVTSELLAPDSSQMPVFKRLEFTSNQWTEIFKLSRQLKLDIWVDVYGTQSLAISDQFEDIHGYKIHVSDILDEPLLKKVGSRNKPVLLSCGGSSDYEVHTAVSFLRSENKNLPVVLMHGFQAYPTALSETHLAGLQRLKNQFDLPVGIMDHNDGDSPISSIIPVVAVALGAEVVEKHITLNRALKETDYYSSLNPDEFKEMVKRIHEIPIAMGAQTPIRSFSEAEEKYSFVAKKKLVLNKGLSKGHVVRSEDITFKRTDDKIFPVKYRIAVGHKLRRDVQAYKAVRYADLDLKIHAVASQKEHLQQLERVSGVTNTSAFASIDSFKARRQFLEGCKEDIILFLLEKKPDFEKIEKELAVFLEKNSEYFESDSVQICERVAFLEALSIKPEVQPINRGLFNI